MIEKKVKMFIAKQSQRNVLLVTLIVGLVLIFVAVVFMAPFQTNLARILFPREIGQAQELMELQESTNETNTVPLEFQDLYEELDQKLVSFEARVDGSWDGSRYPVVFGSELSNANANRGYALLVPTSLDGIRLTLNRLQHLGVKGVKVAINYPLLESGIDTEGDFLSFYKTVAHEVRMRDMKLLVSMGHMFPGFASIPVTGYADSFEEYKEGRRRLAHLIAQEIKPDYLTVIIEPSSEASVTGLEELALPEKQVEMINAILVGLERGTARRGSVQIGAGVGTWEKRDFVDGFSAVNEVDYIDLHVYPINTQVIPPSFSQDFLENVLTYADIAHTKGKKIIMGETWLYKSRTSELALGAFHHEIFGRDPYSFWQPLDQKHLRLLAKIAQYKQFEFISAFWMQYLFAYVDYDAQTIDLNAGARLALAAQKSAENIVENVFSSTGLYYGTLIANFEPTSTPTQLPPLEMDEGLVTAIYASEIVLTGTKAVDTAVHVNGVEVVARNDSSLWSYAPSWGAEEYGEKELTITVVRGAQVSAPLLVTVKRHGLGDITGDGSVDVFDLGVFASNYSVTGIVDTSPRNVRLSDLNQDGEVNVFDLGMFASRYGMNY